MKKVLSVLMLFSLSFGYVGAADSRDASTVVEDEALVFRSDSLDESDESVEGPKTKIEKVKAFLWQHRYKIAIGAGAVVSALCLKKYLDYRKRNELRDRNIRRSKPLSSDMGIGDV